jgi:hypothetical protein
VPDAYISVDSLICREVQYWFHVCGSINFKADGFDCILPKLVLHVLLINAPRMTPLLMAGRLMQPLKWEEAHYMDTDVRMEWVTLRETQVHSSIWPSEKQKQSVKTRTEDCQNCHFCHFMLWTSGFSAQTSLSGPGLSSSLPPAMGLADSWDPHCESAWPKWTPASHGCTSPKGAGLSVLCLTETPPWGPPCWVRLCCARVLSLPQPTCSTFSCSWFSTEVSCPKNCIPWWDTSNSTDIQALPEATGSLSICFTYPHYQPNCHPWSYVYLMTLTFDSTTYIELSFTKVGRVVCPPLVSQWGVCDIPLLCHQYYCAFG